MRPPPSVYAACVVITACLAAACNDRGQVITTPERYDDSALQAVTVFTHLADSVSRAGGDATLGSAYASLADAVRKGGRIAHVTISVDGVATIFVAAAQQTQIIVPAPICATCALVLSSPLRSVIAWQQDDPRRIIQFSSQADSEPIAAYLYPTFAPFMYPVASLAYLDGKAGTFFGTSGTQKFAVTASALPCVPVGGVTTPTVTSTSDPRCTQASVDVSFTSKVEASSFLAYNNPATGSHTIAMTTQSVPGVQNILVYGSTPAPPIVVTPSAPLNATLATTVDRLVTLTLTVSNPLASAMDVAFASSQQYDFSIADATGTVLWRWSAARAFAQMFGTQHLAPNGSMVFTAQWKPTAKGTFVAVGSLVSASHTAAAKAAFTVP